MLNKGYLVIADVSGYTAFLSKTELEHAQDILQTLIQAIIEEVQPPLAISRLQGDAVIAYALDKGVMEGQTLLEAIELIYYRFAATLENMYVNTTCTCNACRLMTTLDLKFVVHYGTFSQQQLGNYVELLGNDVNLAHRLLKNEVVEKTGVEAYVLLTQAAAEAMGVDPAAQGMVPHTETYEHIGEVEAYVHDMKPLWEEEKDLRRIVITPEEALAVVEVDLPVRPVVAWEFVTKAEYRTVMMAADGHAIVDLVKGRTGAGAKYHCAHGELIIEQLIVDWHPFSYYTVKSPGHVEGTELLYSIHLVPTEGGTRLICTAGKAVGPMIARRRNDAWVKKNWVDEYTPILEKFAEFVKEEAAAKEVDASTDENSIPITQEAIAEAVKESVPVA